MNDDKKIVVGRCPHCNRAVVYSDNPYDKTKIKIFGIYDGYHGKTQLCAKCKRMYAVIDHTQGMVVLPILSSEFLK